MAKSMPHLNEGKMIKIYYLGTCSGTEPMPNMHHESSILEIDGAIYWFDMGENCAHSAYTSGIDVTKCEAIFVSHPHIDHIGGMANTLYMFHKLVGMHKKKLAKNNTLELFFPDKEVLPAIKLIALSGRFDKKEFAYNLVEHEIRDGVIFEDERIKVTAKSNRHMAGDGENGIFHAFSFLVETHGKKIVFSGDVKSPSELDTLIGDGVDLLIMETGHHKVCDVCEYALSHSVKKLRFNHHGREILGDRPAAEKLISSYESSHPISIKLTYDGMIEEY